MDQDKNVYYNISPYRMHKSVLNLKDLKELQNVKAIGDNKLIYIDGKSILCLNELESLKDISSKIPIDYLVVGKNTFPVLAEALSYFEVQHLVLDSTVDAKTSENYNSEVNTKGNVYSIEKEGALIIRI